MTIQEKLKIFKLKHVDTTSYKSTEARGSDLVNLWNAHDEHLPMFDMLTVKYNFTTSVSKSKSHRFCFEEDEKRQIDRLTGSIAERIRKFLLVTYHAGITALTSWLDCVANSNGHTRPWLLAWGPPEFDVSGSSPSRGA